MSRLLATRHTQTHDPKKPDFGQGAGEPGSRGARDFKSRLMACLAAEPQRLASADPDPRGSPASHTHTPAKKPPTNRFYAPRKGYK